MELLSLPVELLNGRAENERHRLGKKRGEKEGAYSIYKEWRSVYMEG
jgi:hypothetical protein